MVTRKDFSGHVWGASQQITVDQALRVCTMNGAYASFEENEKGSIAAGKLGDFVILAEDPHDVDPDWIKKTCCRMPLMMGVATTSPSSWFAICETTREGGLAGGAASATLYLGSFVP